MSETTQENKDTPDAGRVRWELTSIGHDYVGLRNVGVDPALDVEVEWVVRQKGQDGPQAVTRRTDLVPEGEATWHNRTPMPHGTDPSVPLEVLWEVRWTHPYYSDRYSASSGEPVDI